MFDEQTWLVDSETLLASFRCLVARTGTRALDEVLSLRDGRQGLLSGILHVLAGPQQLLSRVLARLAVTVQLPVVDGGAGATQVLLAEFNNHFDPHAVASIAMELSLTPSNVLSRIEIARAFTWDQCVEVVARHLPRAAGPGTVILVSGLTSMFDPTQPSHHDGLREMIDGLKRCIQAGAGSTCLVATTPIAPGSTFKPRGGTHLAHFAGSIIVVSEPRVTASGSKVSTWWLIQHPLLPERRVVSWDHSTTARRRRGDMSSFRTLDEFTGEVRS